MITPAQCRAARALLDWPQERLAQAARLDLIDLRRFESGAGARAGVAEALRRILEAAGVGFIFEEGEGACLRATRAKTTIPLEELNAANDE